MCTRPIRIMNRKIDFSVFNDKEFLEVPCGHCHECRNAYRRSYEIRSYYEWRYIRDIGGVAYFYTLTYNDENLPRFNGKPCFDKKGVQKFLRRLDGRVTRRTGHALRYFLTSEYGEQFHRPHYHVIFYLETTESKPLKRGKKLIPREPLNPSQFRKLISDCWQFGFNKAGENRGIVQNINACRYVAKYVCKDFDFIEEFSSEIGQEDIRPFVPFHLQSHGFGLYVFNCMSELQKQYGLCEVPSNRNNKMSEVALPTYLLRKRYYDVVQNSEGTNSYVLNEKGVQRKLLLYGELRCATLDTYEDIRKNHNYEKLPDEFKNDFSMRMQRVFGSDDFDLVFDSILDGRPVSLLYDYAAVYRGRSAVYNPVSALDDLKFFLSPKSDKWISDNYPFEQLDSKKYDDSIEFNGFEELLKLIDFVAIGFRYQRYLKGVDSYNSVQRQRIAKGIYKHSKEIVPLTWKEYISPIKKFTK